MANINISLKKIVYMAYLINLYETLKHNPQISCVLLLLTIIYFICWVFILIVSIKNITSNIFNTIDASVLLNIEPFSGLPL